MALQSQLFRGDPKLEAATVSDSAHILQGASGPHVAKIQQALNLLDGAAIDQDSIYGPATAAAVLAYKQKRDIVNRSYQKQADNIVGKMTMAALDREVLSKEQLLTGPTRIVPIFPLPLPAAQPQAFVPDRGIPRVLGLEGGVPIDVNGPSAPPRQIQLRTNEIGRITAVNGIGKRLVCRNSVNGLVFDPNKPENRQAGSVTVTANPQVFHIRARDPGRTEIVIIGGVDKPLGEIGLILSVLPNVFTEVKTFFHFLDGPKGIKTVRTPSDLDAILKTMNDIYRDQASMQFVNSGVNARLTVRGLGAEFPAVRVNLGGSTADTDAIKRNRDAGVLFNVFFVGEFIDVTNPEGNLENLLAVTSTPPNGNQPLRCCLCRDRLKEDPAVIDPGKTLAHEAGHALGEDDDQKDSSSLMFFSQSGQTDTEITPLMARRMLASFKAFPP